MPTEYNWKHILGSNPIENEETTLLDWIDWVWLKFTLRSREQVPPPTHLHHHRHMHPRADDSLEVEAASLDPVYWLWAANMVASNQSYENSFHHLSVTQCENASSSHDISMHFVASCKLKSTLTKRTVKMAFVRLFFLFWSQYLLQLVNLII